MTTAPYWTSPSGPLGPPQGPQPPTKQPRRGPFGKWVPAICYLAAALLITGLGTALGGSSAGVARQPTENRAPFYGSVVALSQTPAISYQTSANADGVSVDASVTRGGEIEGSFELDGASFGLLVAAGKTYIKPPTSLLSQYVSSGEDASLLAGRWMTDTDVSAELGDATSTLPTPFDLAQDLLAALNESATVWPTPGTKTTNIDGVKALGAKTPSGELYVSAEMPYRVLKFVPTVRSTATSSGASGSAASTTAADLTLTARTRSPRSAKPAAGTNAVSGVNAVADGEFGALPAAAVTELRGLNTELASFRKTGEPGARNAAAAAASYIPVSGATALQNAPVSMAPTETNGDLSKVTAPLQQYFKQLPRSIDEALTSSTTSDGEKPQCSSAGCSETEQVTNTETSTNSSVQVAGGTEDVEMDVTFTVSGEPAGSCDADTKFSLNGSGDVTCDDPEAGPVFAEQLQTKKEQAQAQSESEDGAEVPYEVDFEAEVAITALATVDVTVLTQDFDQEQQQDEQNPDPYAVDASPEPSSQPSSQSSSRPSSQPSSQTSSQTSNEPSYQTPDGTIYPESSNPYEPMLSSTYSNVSTVPEATAEPGTTTTTTAQPVPDTPTEQPAPDPLESEQSDKDACANYRAPGAKPTGGNSSWYVDSLDDATGAVEAGYACLSGNVTQGPAGTSDTVGSAAARAKATAVGVPTQKVQNCHVIAKLLGGGKEPDNMTPCWQLINVSNMETYEGMVSAAKPSTPDEGLAFAETPVYKYANSTIPESYMLTAQIIDSTGATIRILTPSTFTNAQTFPRVGAINLGF